MDSDEVKPKLKVEKKRRREEKASQKADEKSKRLRFSHVEAGDVWPPAIVCTPGFSMKSDAPLDVYSKHDKLLLHGSDHPKLHYVAREDLNQHLRHYVGIYDPDTEKVTIIPAQKMVMQPILKQNRTLEEDTKALATEGNISARMLLGEEFGTNKAKKAVNAQRENNLALDQDVQRKDGKLVLNNAATAVLETMESVSASMATKESLQQQADASKPRPQMNLEAENVADVFSPEELVGQDCLGLLDIRPWRDATQNNEEILLHSKYAIERVIKVVKMDKHNLKRTKQDRLLKYYTVLLDWYRACKRKGKKGDLLEVPRREDLQKKMPDVDNRILDHLHKRFATGSNLDKWHKQYLFTNICAVTLIIDEYSVDMYSLQQDLGLEAKELSGYFREVGCRVKKMTEKDRNKLGLKAADAQGRHLAELRLPLKFPELRHRR